jgi:hypothetical protein
MDDMLARVWENLGGRIGGPMSLRLLIQPTIATLLAMRAGLGDARAGKPPYLWTVLTNAADRHELLRSGWKSVAKVFTMAVVLDVVYQLIVNHWIYPLESFIVAFVLACVPYLLVRGPVNRIASAGRRKRAA